MVVMFIISTDLFLKMTVFGRLPLNDICLLFFFISLSSNVNVYLISSYVVILNIFSVFSSV